MGAWMVANSPKDGVRGDEAKYTSLNCKTGGGKNLALSLLPIIIIMCYNPGQPGCLRGWGTGGGFKPYDTQQPERRGSQLIPPSPTPSPSSRQVWENGVLGGLASHHGPWHITARVRGSGRNVLPAPASTGVEVPFSSGEANGPVASGYVQSDSRGSPQRELWGARWPGLAGSTSGELLPQGWGAQLLKGSGKLVPSVAGRPWGVAHSVLVQLGLQLEELEELGSLQAVLHSWGWAVPGTFPFPASRSPAVSPAACGGGGRACGCAGTTPQRSQWEGPSIGIAPSAPVDIGRKCQGFVRDC